MQIGEGNLLASQRRVGSLSTDPCPMMTPSSLPSNCLVKGCSQTMSWWTVNCPKKCGPSRSLFDQYTALGVQLPYQLCFGNYSGPENGWMLAGDEYVLVRCLYKPAPVAIMELIKCGCKTSCKGHCSCKNNVPSTALCKCHNYDCSNLPGYRMISDKDDV